MLSGESIERIKMTPEQQQLVRYAEVMGWEFWDSMYKQIQHQPNDTYTVSVIGVFVRDEKVAKNNWSRIWNPLYDANDALELAEKMVVCFEGWGNVDSEKQGGYVAWVGSLEKVGRKTLPAAICAAVDVFLDSKKI